MHQRQRTVPCLVMNSLSKTYDDIHENEETMLNKLYYLVEKQEQANKLVTVCMVFSILSMLASIAIYFFK